MPVAQTRGEPLAPVALRNVLGLGLIAMVVLNVANAIGRYGGLTTVSGIDELLVYSMIWIVMVGAVLTTWDRAHLSIDLLPSMLGSFQRTLVRAVVNLASFLICGFVSIHSWMFIDRIGSLGQKSMGLGIPMVVPHFAVFFGFAGVSIVSLYLLAGDIRLVFKNGDPRWR